MVCSDRRTRDALTGLLDRSALIAMLRAALLEDDEHLVLLMLDLDHFDDVNEAFGYAAADALLSHIGERLSAHFTDAHAVARIGGDGFAIVLPAGRADPYRVDEALGEPFFVEGRAVDIGATVGLARSSEQSADPQLLIRRASSAMQAAKRSGRQHATYVSSHDEHRERFLIADELRHALERGELVLHYQPQLDLGTGSLSGVEALLRWRHPVRGVVLPDRFLPAVQGTRLMRRISLWVLDTAIAQHARWGDAGEVRPVSVNLSAQDLVSDDIAALLSHAVQTGRVSPECLTIELTETTIMADPDLAIAALSSFRRLGIRVAIDDFGTGHSSLAYLQRINADELKIDRSFISAAWTELASAAIVQATIELAHRLDLVVVAEGVEDERILPMLRASGCDRAQGFAIARPAAPEAFKSCARVALIA